MTMSTAMVEPEGIAALSREAAGSSPIESSKFKEEVDLDPAVNDGSEVSPARPSTFRVVILTLCMIMTFFLGTVSGTAVALVIPAMARDLETTELEVQWVSSAYSLAYGCGMLFAGRLADLYGRRLLFFIGLTTFLIFTVISGAVKVRVALCVVRAFAGLGLAIAGPAGYGILGATVRHPRQRTVVFAALGLAGPIGAAVGTTLGGAIAGAGRHGWSYIFYVLAGVTLIPIIAGIFVLPPDPRKPEGVHVDRRLDWLGGFLVTAATTLFLFSIVQSGIVPNGWSNAYIPVLLALSVVLFGAFLLWERHLEYNTTLQPAIKFSLFTRHNYKATAMTLCLFSSCASVYGWVYVSTIWYQNLKGLTPLENAVRVLPANIGGMFAAALAMYLSPKIRAPLLIAIPSFMTGIASLLWAAQPEDTSFWACEFIAGILIPYGIDFIYCVGNIMMSNLVEQDEQSVGGALLQTSAQIGSALGICLSSLLSTSRAQATGSLLTGLRDASWMNLAWSWIVPFIVIIGLRSVRLAGDVNPVRTDRRS